MASEFIPRLTIRDARDEALIFAALVDMAHKSTVRMSVDVSEIDTLRRTVELLECVRDNAIQRAANEEFGPVPSDEEIAEELRNLGE